MKIVLTERAIHEFNALNSLTRSKDEKAIELLRGTEIFSVN